MSEMSDSLMMGQPEHKDGRKGAIAQLRQGNFAKGARRMPAAAGEIPMGLWVWVDGQRPGRWRPDFS